MIRKRKSENLAAATRRVILLSGVRHGYLWFMVPVWIFFMPGSSVQNRRYRRFVHGRRRMDQLGKVYLRARGKREHLFRVVK